jgi:hypothetical protein
VGFASSLLVDVGREGFGAFELGFGRVVELGYADFASDIFAGVKVFGFQ